MINFPNINNLETKKVCHGRSSLWEVASHKVKFLGYMIDCSIMPRILRGNTKAPYKLLLHTSYGEYYTPESEKSRTLDKN